MRLGKPGASPVSISRGSELLISDKRFSLKHDKAVSSYTLSIKNVRKSDATKYQCQVMISLDNVVTQTADIKVKLQPAIKEGLSPIQRVVEGKSVQLECEATGFPAPTITWTRKDGSLLPTGKPTFTGTRFQIEKVRREDRGVTTLSFLQCENEKSTPFSFKECTNATPTTMWERDNDAP